MTSNNSIDETTLSTLALLEPRLQRVEHLLHGQTGSPNPRQNEPAILQMANLERRFSALLSRVRVYTELLKICSSTSRHHYLQFITRIPILMNCRQVPSRLLPRASCLRTAVTAILRCHPRHCSRLRIRLPVDPLLPYRYKG